MKQEVEREGVLLFSPREEAKSMVSLASKSVLSEYWSSGSGEHTSGKLRVRGVRIRGVPGKVSNHCEVNM